MPKLLLKTGITLVALSLALLVVLYCYAYATGQNGFWSNTGLNLAAEFMGVGFGIGIPLIVIARSAKKRFDKTASQFAELVAQLRAEGKISKQVARRSMVCVVNVIPQEHISMESNNRFSLGYENSKCDVCDLRIKIGEDRKCDFCKLEKHVWSIEHKPEIPAHYSKPEKPLQEVNHPQSRNS